MKTLLPNITGLSGLHFVGVRRSPVDTSGQQVGVMLLKREYSLSDSVLQPTTDTNGIRVQDVTVPSLDEINQGGADFAHVIAENDLAPFKPRVDIIVEGGYEDGDRCQLRVQQGNSAAATWFSRSGTTEPLLFPNPDDEDDPISIADTDGLRNMFGWQPKHIEPRLGFGRISTVPATVLDTAADRPLDIPFENISWQFHTFNNAYFNGYRRSFADNGLPASNLDSDATITIIRERGGEETHWSFDLLGERFQCNYFTYDGVSPDKQRNWCRHPIAEFRLDTVVINLRDNRVYALWRGTWAYDIYPEDRYRMLRVNFTPANVAEEASNA